MYPIYPNYPIGAPPRAANAPRPSVAAIRLLVLAALVLWLAALGEAILALFWICHLELLNMRLPWLAAEVFGVCRWINCYWWVVLLAIMIAMPLLTRLTYFVFSRVRNPAGRGLWGALLIVPPLVFLGVLRWSVWVTEVKAVRVLLNPTDAIEFYLAPDGTLLTRIVLREVARGLDGAVDETLAIESNGEWQITRGPARVPVRRGRLSPAQLAILGRHLATLLQPDRQPAFGEVVPEGAGDLLSLDTGGAAPLSYPGLTRARLRNAVPPMDREQADAWSRFVAMVLILDDMVRPSEAGG